MWGIDRMDRFMRRHEPQVEAAFGRRVKGDGWGASRPKVMLYSKRRDRGQTGAALITIMQKGVGFFGN